MKEKNEATKSNRMVRQLGNIYNIRGSNHTTTNVPQKKNEREKNDILKKLNKS